MRWPLNLISPTKVQTYLIKRHIFITWRSIYFFTESVSHKCLREWQSDGWDIRWTHHKTKHPFIARIMWCCPLDLISPTMVQTHLIIRQPQSFSHKCLMEWQSDGWVRRWSRQRWRYIGEHFQNNSVEIVTTAKGPTTLGNSGGRRWRIQKRWL